MPDNQNKQPVPYWKGHSLASYIGAPMQAAIESSIMAAKSTVDFINDVGTVADKDGNVSPRNIPFYYNRSGFDNQTGKTYSEQVLVEVPLLSLVKVPTIEIQKVDYSFSLEVKSVTTSDSGLKSNGKGGSQQTLDSPIAKLYGMMSASHDQTRRTDKSTKMHLNIQAERGETPEGLARVLDLMNQSVTPLPVKRDSLPNEQTKPNARNTPAKEDLHELYERLKQLLDE